MAFVSFNGVITEIQEKHPNDWKENYIKLSVSSTLGDKSRAFSIIDRSVTGNSSSNNWCSDRFENQYFIVSFPKNNLMPSFYGLQSKNSGEPTFPVSWKLEGSNDLTTWIILDQKVKQESLKGVGHSAVFPIKIGKKTFKHFKFTQLENYDNINSPLLCLRKFEIFNQINPSCMLNRPYLYHLLNILSYIFILLE